MSGQGSGLNQKLRKLFARIQKDFDYPKVFAVKCHIPTHLQTWQGEPDPLVRSLPEPVTSAHDLAVLSNVSVVEGRLEEAGVRRMTLMEELETTINDADCWDPESTPIHSPELTLAETQVNTMELDMMLPKVAKIPLRIPPVRIKNIRIRPSIRVKRNLGMGQSQPMRLKMRPMKELPMKMQIRYRGGVLKMLNVKPNQVKFIGICSIPPAPLRMVDVITEFDGTVVLARVVGAANSLLGPRVWVIIEPPNRNGYLPITVKEE